MASVTEQKAGMLTLKDAFAVAVSKKGTEELLARTPVGNGSFKSAFVKGVGALGLGAVKNPYVRYVATGMGLDAFEDLITSVKRVYMMRKEGTANPTNAGANSGSLRARF